MGIWVSVISLIYDDCESQYRVAMDSSYGVASTRRLLKIIGLFCKIALQKRHEFSAQFTIHSTGWRRPIGCLKLHFIFCKRATNYRALLRKWTHTDKMSYVFLCLVPRHHELPVYISHGIVTWESVKSNVQVSFCKRVTNHMALLRKEICKDTLSSCQSWNSYTRISHDTCMSHGSVTHNPDMSQVWLMGLSHKNQSTHRYESWVCDT